MPDDVVRDDRRVRLITRITELSHEIEQLKTQRSATPKLLATFIALQPLLAGVLVAGAGTFATITYNRQQLAIAQINALDKYRVYLVSEDPLERQFGYEAFVALGQEAFVAKLIGIKKDPAGENVLITITEQSDDAAARDAARQSLLSLPQERRIVAIVNIFETGNVQPNYSQVTAFKGDPGLLSYGYGQTSLGSGNLLNLVRSYVESPGARFSGALAPYLARIEAKDASLATDLEFRQALNKAGTDPVMQRLQDNDFRAKYIAPALTLAQRLGITTPLGIAVIYDSLVQGSFQRLRKEVDERDGTVQAIGEKKWVASYVARRREFLAARPAGVSATVFRTDAFLKLISENNWDLLPPLNVRGVTIEDPTNQPAPEPENR